MYQITFRNNLNPDGNGQLECSTKTVATREEADALYRETFQFCKTVILGHLAALIEVHQEDASMKQVLASVAEAVETITPDEGVELNGNDGPFLTVDEYALRYDLGVSLALTMEEVEG